MIWRRVWNRELNYIIFTTKYVFKCFKHLFSRTKKLFKYTEEKSQHLIYTFCRAGVEEFPLLQQGLDIIKHNEISKKKKKKSCFVSLTMLAWYLLLAGQGFNSPTLIFSSTFFFIFILFANPPSPIVPAMWRECSFLDSHSARRRTALQLPAKTPYLCLAACRQDGGLRVRWEGWRG